MTAIRSLLLVLALGLPTVADGQVTAVINGPRRSDPGDLIVLDATGSAASAFRWVLVGSQKSYLPIDGGKRVVFASGQAGDYHFVLVTAGKGVNESLEVATAERVVTIGTPTPPPEPPKPPDPPQPPTPPAIEGKIVLLVRETSDVTPAMARTEVNLRDGPAAKYLAEKKLRLLILSDDQALPATVTGGAKEAFYQAKAGKLPAVAVISDSGAFVVESIKPDASADDILAIVKKHGGAAWR